MIIALYSVEVLIGFGCSVQSLCIGYTLLIDDFGGELASLFEMTSLLQTMVFIVQPPSIDVILSGLISALTCD